MSLRVGDKVKMTKRGFQFYANVDIQFAMSSVGRKMDYKHFTQAICEQFAIHGVGVVKKFNSQGEPYIRWEFSLNGMRYYYSHYFEEKNVQKLTLLDKLRLKLRKILC